MLLVSDPLLGSAAGDIEGHMSVLDSRADPKIESQCGVFCDDGPEYLIHAPGVYERWYRKYDQYESLAPEERVMLDGCCAIFAPLAHSSAHRLKAPTTPKYQVKARPLPR